MNRFVAFLFFLLPISLFAENQALGLFEAEEISYQKDTSLISARELKVRVGKSFTLECSHAQFDAETYCGTFIGSGDEHPVLFHGDVQGVGQEPVSFQLKSGQFHIDVTPFGRDVIAESNVEIELGNDLHIFSDSARYLCQTPSHSPFGGLFTAGVLLLLSDEEAMNCRIKTSTGDVIHAKEIEVDLVKRTILCSGASCEFLVGDSRQKVAVDAPKVFFNLGTETLIFEEGIEVRDELYGTLHSEGTLEAKIDLSGTMLPLEAEVRGKTELTFFDPTKRPHQFISYGTISYSSRLATLKVTSPKDSSGRILRGKEIYFHDDLGTLIADSMAIEASFDQGKVQLKQAALEGNLRIRNQFAENPQFAGILDQYLLADQASYQPNNQKLSLSAYSGKRVLLFDAVHQMSVSAPAIHLKRNPTSKKEEIKGVGHVRFHFGQHEMESLKAAFQDFPVTNDQ